MLKEEAYLTDTLLPALRENAGKQKAAVKKQLNQWQGEKKNCSLLLHLTDCALAAPLSDYDNLEIYYDSEKMFVSELKEAVGTALAKGDGVASVRANMGCGLGATLLGVEQLVFADKKPWVKGHLSKERLASLTPDHIIESADYKRALEHMRYMKERLVGTGIAVYPLDLQGSVDMAHIVLGDDFFYELYDDEGFIRHLMELVNGCVLKMASDYLSLCAPEAYIPHYNSIVLPREQGFKISEDTSTLLKREHILDFAKNYTGTLFNALGGGYVHYCGKNDHLLDMTLDHMPKSLGFNFGDAAKHDMPTVLKRGAEARKYYYGLTRKEELKPWLSAAYLDERHYIFPWVNATQEEEESVLLAFAEAKESAEGG